MSLLIFVESNQNWLMSFDGKAKGIQGRWPSFDVLSVTNIIHTVGHESYLDF